MEQQRLGAPDLLAEPAIALRLARLLLQRLELRLDRRDDVVEPREIVLGGVELQLGLVAARMQPGGAGGLVEQKPPLGRLGVDQRADPALARPSRRNAAPVAASANSSCTSRARTSRPLTR